MRYTRAELVSQAAERGYQGSLDRTFKSYVGAGLMAHATSPGKGRGAGRALGTWNEAQRLLWFSLLEGRRNGYKLREHANAPVWLWLMHGEDVVPLTQARRALQTWVGPPGKWDTRREARQVARAALAEVDHRAARPIDRKRLLKIVEDAAWYGKLDRDELRDVANTVAKHAKRNPLDAQFRFDPDLLADLLDTRIRVIKTLSSIPSAWFERARLLNLGGLRWYEKQAANAAADPRIAAYTPKIDWVERSGDACNTVLALLGLVLLDTTKPMPAIDGLTALATLPDHPQPPATIGAPATTAMARGHGTGTLEVPDATPP